MEEIRKKQEIEKSEWKSIMEEGYRLSEDGKKYKIEDLNN